MLQAIIAQRHRADFSSLSPALWLAADALALSNNDPVDSFADISGNARHATGSGATRPTFVTDAINGRPVVRFGGTQYLTISGSASSLKFLHYLVADVFAVVKYGTTSNPLTSYGLIGTNANNSTNIGFSVGYEDRAVVTSANNAAFFSATAGGLVTASRGFDATITVFSEFNNLLTPNQFKVVRYSIDSANATAASRAKVSVNGGTALGNQTFTGTPSSSNSSYDMNIGALGNANAPLVGDIAEIVVFNRALTSDERLSVTGKLNHKYLLFQA